MMLRWLPEPLARLYRRLVTATPFAPSPRFRPQAAPEPAQPCGKRRLMRLNIAQDAFCRHRPKPRTLFRDLPYPRDPTSWCEDRSWHAKRGYGRDPICSDCAHARATFRAACNGDWKAECRLHRLATRGARRLLGERRKHRHERKPLLAAIRERLARRTTAPEAPPFDCQGYCRPSHGGLHHIHDRRDEEAELMRAHAQHLHRLIQKKRARLRERDRARERAARDAAREHDPAGEHDPAHEHDAA